RGPWAQLDRPNKVWDRMPMAFHTLNGVRHLCWDMGYGFELKNLYTTGWFVLGVSLAVGIGIATV
ncbi:succinate dehydrogenase, partial [Apostichopus japonicus]